MVGLPVELADAPLVREYRDGEFWRAFCTVHVQKSFNRELWAIRSRLSAWLPRATSEENRKNFHISFDSVV